MSSVTATSPPRLSFWILAARFTAVSKIVQHVVRVHGDARAMMNADLQVERGPAASGVILLDDSMHFEAGLNSPGRIEERGHDGVADCLHDCAVALGDR